MQRAVCAHMCPPRAGPLAFGAGMRLLLLLQAMLLALAGSMCESAATWGHYCLAGGWSQVLLQLLGQHGRRLS